MKKSTIKIKTILSGKKGESLIESLASLFVFLMLMLAITTMMKYALHITSVYTGEAKSHQENQINEGVMETYSGAARSSTLTLQDGGGNINVTIRIEAPSIADGYEAFNPVP